MNGGKTHLIFLDHWLWIFFHWFDFLPKHWKDECQRYQPVLMMEVSVAVDVSDLQVCPDLVGGERQELDGISARQKHLLQSVSDAGGRREAESLVQRRLHPTTSLCVSGEHWPQPGLRWAGLKWAGQVLSDLLAQGNGCGSIGSKSCDLFPFVDNRSTNLQHSFYLTSFKLTCLLRGFTSTRCTRRNTQIFYLSKSTNTTM